MYPVFPTRIIVLHAHPQVIYCNRQTDGTMDRVIPIYPPNNFICRCIIKYDDLSMSRNIRD